LFQQGKDHTLMARVEGYVRFWKDHPNSSWKTKRRWISVENTRAEAVAKQVKPTP
jgi:ribosomal protein L27